MEEAWDDSRLAVGEKVKSKKEVILEAQRDKKKVHFATLMDLCRLKKCGVRTKATEVQRQSRASGETLSKTIQEPTQFLPNRARLRPRWLLQKIMDVIARLPGCDGQAAHAVSACT